MADPPGRLATQAARKQATLARESDQARRLEPRAGLAVARGFMLSKMTRIFRPSVQRA
jgi:hypothetical protein